MFESALLKIARADAQTNHFASEVNAFFGDADAPACRSAIQRDADDPRKWAATFRVLKEQPDTWPIHIGEIIHNLRSALDHLVYEASAPDENGRPLTRTEFPIFIDEDDFNRRGGEHKIRGLNAETRALVKRYQPFTNTDPVVVPYLWILQQLSNTDKHRLLNLVSIMHTLTETQVIYHCGGTPLRRDHVVHRATLGDHRLENGAEYFSFWTPEPLPAETTVGIDTEIAFRIAFGDATPVANGLPVLDLLEGIGRLVDGIRNEFVRLNAKPI